MSPSNSSSTMRSLDRLARAMVHMSQRVPTDNEAKEFKMNQLRKSITGTQITQRPIQPKHRGGNITGHLLEMSTTDDSHLALKRPGVIGCHSPRVLAEKNLSALDLHHEEKHCMQCASAHQVRMTDVPLNPFSCWRRGHRSENFGFLFNQIIQPTQHDVAGWVIGSEREIYTSPRLKLALQHLRSEQVNVFPEEAPRHMGRSMVVVATVRWSMDASKEISKSVNRVLDVQYLHSINKQQEAGQEVLEGEGEKLYEFVKQFVTEVSGFWRRSAGLSRRNSLGVLSMAVVHCSDENELDFLSSALNEVVEQKNTQFIPFEKLKPGQLQQLGLDDGRFQPHGSQFAICLFLDPIVDLVMEHV